MLSRTFKYIGYDGQPHEDTYWFNLSEAELWKMELGSSGSGGMQGMMRRLFRNAQTKEIVDVFESIILSSVGERSADGRRFIKNDEIRNDFFQSKAYSDLFVELVTDSDKLVAFIKGIIPEELAKKIEENEIPTEPSAAIAAVENPVMKNAAD